MTSAIRSLYLHVPFCERKCEYCDFTSVAGVRGADAYMRALCDEVRLLGAALPGTRLDTVFVGGGTPSLVDPPLLRNLLLTAHESFTVAEDAEITLEANPSSTTHDRASAWRSAGYNRVSIGVQSLDAGALRFLGRVHDAGEAMRAVAAAHAAGFDNVNCDLIYAVPGLDDATWTDTLHRVTAAQPAHVSCYELTVETGTPLHRSVRLGHVRPVAGERALRQHALAVSALERAGFPQYEVSNFASPGRECRHNLAYWHNAFYLAAGVGAHGHVPAEAAGALGLPVSDDAVAVRYWHGRGIGAFVETMERGRLPVRGSEALDAPTREVERVMLGLRLRDGIDLAPAQSQEAQALAGAGLLHLEGARARTTRRGERVLNAIALRLAERAA